jgi:hypothetical protein
MKRNTATTNISRQGRGKDRFEIAYGLEGPWDNRREISE